jgi:dienelactone hydrolase
MSAETVSALSSVDLTTTTLPATSLRRILLIGRDASGVDTRLHDHLEQAGVDVTVMSADDYRVLVMVPDMGLTPSTTIKRSVDWWMRDPRRLINERTQVEQRLEPAAAAIAPARVAVNPEAVSEVEFESHGVRIRERLLDIEFGSGQLVGVLAEPVDGARPPFCLVSVNAASLRHTGPSRVMVELARRAAATGLVTVRLDLPGLGDSDGSAPKAHERNDADNIESVAALGALYEQLEASGIAERFVSLGLCLGAYVAALAALADQRSLGAIALNPQFAWGRREVRRQRRWAHSLGALDASSADKGSTRVVTAVLKPALQRARKLNNQLQAALGPRLARRRLFQRLLLFWPDRTVCRLLRQLGASGTRVLLVCSSAERLMLDIKTSGPRSRELARWPNLVLAPLATDSHLLYPLWSQDECLEVVLSYLDEIRGVAAKEDHGGRATSTPPSAHRARRTRDVR